MVRLPQPRGAAVGTVLVVGRALHERDPLLSPDSPILAALTLETMNLNGSRSEDGGRLRSVWPPRDLAAEFQNLAQRSTWRGWGQLFQDGDHPDAD